MRNHIVAFIILLFLVSAPCWAAEPTRKEKRFLKTLATALADESEDVRAAAAKGLGAMGAKAAHYLVREIGRLKPEAREGAVDVLIALGSYTRVELADLKKMPGGAAGEALKKVKDALEGVGGVGGFGDVDPKADLVVREVMSTLPTDSWSSHDPGIDRLAAPGRAAIPSLLTYLDPKDADAHGSHSDWAQSALLKLCGPRDVPRLGGLLDEGWEGCAKVLKGIGDPSAVPYLVRALERGQLTMSIGEALKSFADESARKPAIAYLEQLEGFPSGMMPLLEMLVRLRAREALPALRRIVERQASGEPDAPDFPSGIPDNAKRTNMICGRALASLGDPRGVEMLIDVLDAGGYDKWLVSYAGETLNSVTGQAFWQRGVSGAAARSKYQTWWRANKDDLEWVEKRRRFVAR